jgi:fructose-specific phosphotransferase system component IIB
MTIKFADQTIHEARQRIVALDRDLAELRRQSHSRYLSRQVKQEMRAQSALLAQQRCEAYMELMELVELAEMPPEFMGWA